MTNEDMLKVNIAAAQLEKENYMLRSALHDAINKTKGVVPFSAEQFYEPTRWYP